MVKVSQKLALALLGAVFSSAAYAQHTADEVSLGQGDGVRVSQDISDAEYRQHFESYHKCLSSFPFNLGENKFNASKASQLDNSKKIIMSRIGPYNFVMDESGVTEMGLGVLKDYAYNEERYPEGLNWKGRDEAWRYTSGGKDYKLVLRMSRLGRPGKESNVGFVKPEEFPENFFKSTEPPKQSGWFRNPFKKKAKPVDFDLDDIRNPKMYIKQEEQQNRFMKKQSALDLLDLTVKRKLRLVDVEKMKTDSVYRGQVFRSFENCRSVPGGEYIPEELAQMNRNSFKFAMKPVRQLIESLNLVAGEALASKQMDAIRGADKE